MSNVIFARVQPDGVRIVETYRYEQTLGLASRVSAAQAPVGEIKVAISYDGYQSFTRQAYADVRRQYGRWLARAAIPALPSRLRRVVMRLTKPMTQMCQRFVRLLRRRSTVAPVAATDLTPPTDALIGHLLLDNYDRTDLGVRYDLYNRFGTLPLRVPISDDPTGKFQNLVADRTAAAITFDYTPKAFDIAPVRMTAQISDAWESAWPDAEASKETILAFLTQTDDVQDFLRFSLRLELNLPRKSLPDHLPIYVKQLRLEWPSPLSVTHGVAYLLTGEAKPAAMAQPVAPSLKYDPIGRRLEWGGMPLQPTPLPTRPDLTTLISQPLHLIVARPADLYQVDCLNGRAYIEIPGLLLSGLHASYHDGIGRRLDQVNMEKTSRLLIRFKLSLADLFSRREHLLFRQVFVEHITLRSLHMSDLDSHLSNSNFRLTRVLYNGVGDNDWSAIFGVEQIAKPQSLQAWVSLYNRRHATTVGQGLNRLSVGNVHIRLNARSTGNPTETGLALNRLQTALVAYFEETKQ